jgi:Tol biopolymer transport system component
MTVSTPPRPPSPARVTPDSEPLSRDEIEALVEALIEEARRETRRRHRRYWAVAALVTFVGVVALALLDGGAASQTAAPGVSAQSNSATRAGTSRIAFLRGDLACRPAGRCNDELYLINADGTGLRRLTRNAVFDGSPVWSPDGRSIAFTRDRDRQTVSIHVMNADGSHQRRLTLLPRRGGAPRWSPDGQKIAFVAPAGHLGAADIFVMNPDGSDLRNVTNTVTTSFDFAWSPDGRRIAYLEASPGKGGGPLSVVNADGTGKHPLKGTLMVDFGIPSWSPDGRTIAFTGGSVIYTVHADGTGLRKLTHGPGHNLAPQWSPDGRRILFLSVRDDLARYAFDLFVMNADGSGQRNLTHTPGVSELGASWAPS